MHGRWWQSVVTRAGLHGPNYTAAAAAVAVVVVL